MVKYKFIYTTYRKIIIGIERMIYCKCFLLVIINSLQEINERILQRKSVHRHRKKAQFIGFKRQTEPKSDIMYGMLLESVQHFVQVSKMYVVIVSLHQIGFGKMLCFEK